MTLDDEGAGLGEGLANGSGEANATNPPRCLATNPEGSSHRSRRDAALAKTRIGRNYRPRHAEELPRGGS